MARFWRSPRYGQWAGSFTKTLSLGSCHAKLAPACLPAGLGQARRPDSQVLRSLSVALCIGATACSIRERTISVNARCVDQRPSRSERHVVLLLLTAEEPIAYEWHTL